MSEVEDARHCAQADALILSALRGLRDNWPAGRDDGLEKAVLRRVDYHGVAGLLNERSSSLGGWPVKLLESVRQRAIGLAVWELRHEVEISRALKALADGGIVPLLFKGTALAYELYTNPVLRSRSDTDVLVAERDATRARDILGNVGFQRVSAAGGELVSSQGTFVRSCGDGGDHAIDLHWRLNNSAVLSRLWSHAELRESARALPALGPHAMAVGPIHAMLLACIHPTTHRHNPYYSQGVAYLGGDRLVWYYDIHLLAQSFGEAEWQDLVAEAARQGLCEITRDGLEGASERFGTRYPSDVRTALDRRGEAVSVYLAAGRMRQAWLDFLATRGAASRASLLRELFVPPADYMHKKYADARVRWLPWLYARRAAEGFVKRLASKAAGGDGA